MQNYFFCVSTDVSPSVCLYETNFPYKGGHTQVVEEAKMLIKLIVVNPNHFVRYNFKIMHCLYFQTSDYISTSVLDDN